MRAPPDHRDEPSEGKPSLPSTAPTASASIVRSRLFIKYVVLFVAVVSLALIANALFDIYFSYQEQKSAHPARAGGIRRRQDRTIHQRD
jgi:two-component system, NtrC family, sensor kinase